MDIDNSPLYSIDAAAEVLNCTRSWLRDQITAGTVPHGRLGKRKGVFFTAEDITAIVDERRRPARPRISAACGTVAAPNIAHVEVPARFAGLRSARAQP